MKHVKESLFNHLNIFKILTFVCLFSFNFNLEAQINWTNDGDSYFKLEKNQLVTYTLPNHAVKTVISKEQLIPEGKTEPLEIAHFSFSLDQQKILLFTNTKKVWRLNTKGDYWVFNFKTNALTQIGKSLAPSSLMFAKFSPDGNTIAYVSANNLYSEDYASGEIQPLTTNGTVSLINGTVMVLSIFTLKIYIGTTGILSFFLLIGVGILIYLGITYLFDKHLNYRMQLLIKESLISFGGS